MVQENSWSKNNTGRLTAIVRRPGKVHLAAMRLGGRREDSDEVQSTMKVRTSLALRSAILLVQTEKGSNALANGFTAKFACATLKGLQFGVGEKTVVPDAHGGGSFALSRSVVVVNACLIFSSKLRSREGGMGGAEPQSLRFRY